jgi:hypothetical protein
MRGSRVPGSGVAGSVPGLVVRLQGQGSRFGATRGWSRLTRTRNLNREPNQEPLNRTGNPGTRQQAPTGNIHFSIPAFVELSADRIASRLRPWTADRAKRRSKPLSERVRARLTEIM